MQCHNSDGKQAPQALSYCYGKSKRVWMSGCLDVWMSGCLDLHMGFVEIVEMHTGIVIARAWDYVISYLLRFPRAPDADPDADAQVSHFGARWMEQCMQAAELC